MCVCEVTVYNLITVSKFYIVTARLFMAGHYILIWARSWSLLQLFPLLASAWYDLYSCTTINGVCSGFVFIMIINLAISDIHLTNTQTQRSLFNSTCFVISFLRYYCLAHNSVIRDTLYLLILFNCTKSTRPWYLIIFKQGNNNQNYL